MQMVLLGSHNVQSFLVIRSYTSSLSQTRQERFGIILIMVGFKFNLLNEVFFLRISTVQRLNTVMVFVVHS